MRNSSSDIFGPTYTPLSPDKDGNNAGGLLNQTNHDSSQYNSVLESRQSVLTKKQEKSAYQSRKKTLKQFTSMSDYAEIPIVTEELPFWYFNQDFYSTQREYNEVKDICEENTE